MIDSGSRFHWADESAEGAEFKHSYALIIGINDYSAGIRSLATAANDAYRLAVILSEKHGYEVSLLTEGVTCARLKTELCERLPGRIDENDRFLFYFAGHGIATKLNDDFQEPEGFLLLHDAVQDQSSTYLPMAQLHQWLLQLRCRHLLAVLDCCFAGAFRWSIATRESAPDRADVVYLEKYRRYIQDPAWQVITSASFDQRALDHLGGDRLGERGEATSHSPFAQALFDGLGGKADLIPKNGGDGLITATELQLYLRDTIDHDFSGIVRRRQTPELWHLRKHNKGEFVFTLCDLALPLASDHIPDSNPYCGLDSYSEADAELFYGREKLSEKLRLQVCTHPFTVVLGASGTGKSSLVKAGLLPRLRGATNPAWQLLPSLRPGAEPLRRLDEILKTVDAADNILLVVDQAEELVTLCQANERAQFIERLYALLTEPGGRIHIVLTLRNDFEPHIRNTHLQAYWESGRFIVAPMNQEELKEAIELPAAKRVLFFDPPGLVDKIAGEVVHEPHALPLLSFTLSQLYQRYRASKKRNRTLTSEDYDAIGGVVGILSRCADEIYNGLDEAHKLTMRRLLLRMVTLESGEKARRRVARSELIYPSTAENQRTKSVLQQLTDARLLVADTADGNDETFVEPAHEALINAWDKLSEWLREEDDTLLLHRNLTQAASLWSRARNSDKHGLLWNRDPRLAQIHQTVAPQDYAKWHGLHRTFLPTTHVSLGSSPLNNYELEFVQASIRQKAAAARWTAVLVLVFMAAGLGLWNLSRIAATEWQTRQIAESRRLANIALQEIEVDPVHSIELSRSGLPAEGQDRPYVPEVENALTQAIQRNQLRQAVAIQTTSGEQVDFGAEFVAVGGESLLLFARHDYTAVQPPPINEPTHLPDEKVKLVAWAGNGDLLALDDRTARIWRNGNLLQARTVDDLGYISCAVWSPHSSMIALCTGQQVRVWRLDADEVLTLPSFPAYVNSVSWSANEDWLAVSTPEQVSVHAVADGEPTVIFRSFAADIQAGRFIAPTELLTWGYDGQVRRWSISGKLLGIYTNRDAEAKFYDVQLSPDGAWLAAAYDNGMVDLWPLSGRNLIPKTLPAHPNYAVLDLAWHDKYLATAGADGTIGIWDWQRAELVTRLAGHKGRVHRIAWEAAGDQLVSYGADGTLRTWQVFDARGFPVCDFEDGSPATWRCTTLLAAQLQAAEPPLEVRWIDNAHVVGATIGGEIWTWRIGDEAASITNSYQPVGLGAVIHKTRLSRSGAYAFVFSQSEKGELWRINSGAWERLATFAQTIESAFWSDDQLIIVTPPGQIDVVTITADKPTHHTIQAAADSSVWEANVQNGRVAVAYQDGRLAMFDLDSNQQLFSLPSELATQLGDFTWLDGGTKLLTLARSTGALSLIDANDGKSVWPSLWHEAAGDPLPPLPHPTGAYAIFAIDSTLYGVNLDTGAELILAQIPSTFRGLQWNGSGSRLLTWDSGGAARIWYWNREELSLTQILELRAGRPLSHAAYSPDETHVMTVDADGNVQIWQVWPTLEALLKSAPG